MESLVYKMITGKKSNSVLLYVIEEKQLFKVKSKTNKKTYYVCYEKKCSARLELSVNGFCSRPKKYTDHNHGNQESKYNEITCIDDIRKDCLTAASVLGDVNALSGIRCAFKRTCEK